MEDDAADDQMDDGGVLMIRWKMVVLMFRWKMMVLMFRWKMVLLMIRWKMMLLMNVDIIEQSLCLIFIKL